MKKRISGILALSLTLALTFGMTVFAAPSPDTTTDVTVDAVVEVKADTAAPSDTQEVAKLEAESAELNQTVGTVQAAAVEVNGQTVAVTVEAPKPVEAGVMNSAKTTATTIVAKLVTENKIAVTENKVAVATPIAATDIKINLPAGITEIPAAGIQLTIPVSTLKVDPSKTYLLMHLRESDGVWETIPVDSIKDGEIKATFKSLSPIVVVEVAQQDAPADNSNDSDDEPAAAAPAAEGTSPKTGEAVPVAGLFVLAALAGAAYSAKKLSYRK